MSEPAVRPRLAPVAVLTLVVLLVALRLLGAFTIGVVATDSMEPTLPAGTLFLALPSDPAIESIIVFTSPDDERIVHRVVGIEPDGLVTQGDANRQSDQDAGWPPVDPEDVQVIPTPAGHLVAMATPVKGFLLIALTQVVLFGIALLGGVRMMKKQLWLRPHHLLLIAAAALLVSAPLFVQEYDDPEEIQVSSSFVPVVVHISNGEDQVTHSVAPFQDHETGIHGPATVTIAPAMPGTKALIPHGAFAAFLPLVALVCLFALLFRIRGG